MTTDWTWITVPVAMAVHAEQISQHGGGEAVLDTSLLESALARASNFAGYAEADAAALAAAYAFGIARNHPFVDGNKRMAAVISETFLVINGFRIEASDAEIVVVFLDLAADKFSEAEVADWFRERLRKS